MNCLFTVYFLGLEPGYIATPICMVQAALVILNERDAMPKR